MSPIRRSLILALSLCLSAWTGFAQTNLFLLPNTSSTTPTVTAFRLDPFTVIRSFNVQPGASFFLTNAAGTKYYSIARSGSDTLLVLDATNPATVLKRQNLAQAEAAVLTPDGRRLLIVAGGLHIFDTNNDSLLNTVTSVGSNPADVAVSLDSTRAYVLSSTSNRLSAVDLNTNNTVGNPLTIPGLSTGVTVGYNGLVYVTAQNRLFEIDGQTMTIRHEIPLNARPGKLSFTQDGRYALAVNQTPVTGSSVLLFDLQSRTLAGTLPNAQSIGTIDSLSVVSANKVYAVSSQTQSLFEITIDPLNIDTPQFANIGNLNNVSGVVVTNENPAAKYIFAVTPGSITRLDNSSAPPAGAGTAATPANPGALVFSAPAATGTPSRVIGYNNNQTTLPGTAYLPLIARVFDTAGRPLMGVPVTFTTDNSSAEIQGATVTSNTQGYAQTRVIAPPSAGTFTVTATAGTGGTAPTYQFTLTTGANPGGGSATTALSIVGGHGQLVREQFLLQDALTVQLKDLKGNPVPDQTITFAIQSGAGTLAVTTGNGTSLPGTVCSANTCEGVTDVEGKASVSFLATSVNPGIDYAPQTITATNGTSTVNFIVTTIRSVLPGGGSASPPIVDRIVPTENIIVGQAGTVLPGAIKVRVVVVGSVQSGQGMPNVSLRVKTPNVGNSGPTATCEGEGGIALTDAMGLATCNLIIGGKTGTAPLEIIVGGSLGLGGGVVTLDVRPGPPSKIRIVQGNNQSGAPGATLPLAFLAEITDAAGNPLPGVAATWEVPVANSVTLKNVVAVADSNGRVSALGTLGSMGGANVVRVKAGEATATFNFTTNVPIGGFQISSGSGQSAVVGQPFAQPVAVRVTDSQGQPLANQTVMFTVTAGSAALSAASAITNSSGVASVNVTAGTQAGAISVRASLNSNSLTFNLTARLPGPAFTASQVVNSASYQEGLAPCGLATLYGAGLAPGVNGVVNGTPNGSNALPLILQDVEIAVDGQAAPILAVANQGGSESVVFQTPCGINTATRLTSVTVKVSGSATTVNDVRVGSAQPGIFEVYPGGNQRAYGAAQRPDGSYVTQQNPARRGEIIRMFVTGLGIVNPAAATNRVGVGGQMVVAPVIVGINDAGVRIVSAEYTPGLVGIYTVAFEVPANTTPGANRNLAIAVQGANGELIFGNPSTLPIQ